MPFQKGNTLGKLLIGRNLSEEHKQNISKGRTGKALGNTNRNGVIPWNKGKKSTVHTSENIKKMLKRNPKSSLEIKFEEIVQKNNLPYKFVGNGGVLIEKKCPDFVNCNGQKIAIDVFYKKHKEKFRNGLGAWKEERATIFNRYGWELIFLDETQVNEDFILKTLTRGD